MQSPERSEAMKKMHIKGSKINIEYLTRFSVVLEKDWSLSLSLPQTGYELN
jgi:hypothetical protein